MLLQVTELKKKQHVQSQLSTKRPKGDEATRRLQFEIQSLKAQKVPYCCRRACLYKLLFISWFPVLTLS